MDTTPNTETPPNPGFTWDGPPATPSGVPPMPAAPARRHPSGRHAASPARPRRRHAAKRSRVVAGVLSALTFLGLAGGMAARSAGTSTTATSTSSGGSVTSGSRTSDDSGTSTSDDSSSSGSTGWSAAPGSSGSTGTQPSSVSHAS